MANSETILDLSTLVPVRQTVRLVTTHEPEGQLYGFRTRDELGLVQLKTLETRAKEMMKYNPEKLTGPQTVRMQQLLDDTLQDIVFADALPPEVMAELPISYKMKILDTFTEVCLRGLTQADKAKPKGQTSAT